MKKIIHLCILLFSLSAQSVEFRPGNRLIDQYGNTGELIHLLTNQKAEIILDNYPDMAFVRELSTLGKSVGCLVNACVSQRIIDEYGNSGSLKEVFHNGMAKISLDLYEGYFTRSLDTLKIVQY